MSYQQQQPPPPAQARVKDRKGGNGCLMGWYDCIFPAAQHLRVRGARTLRLTDTLVWRLCAAVAPARKVASAAPSAASVRPTAASSSVTIYRSGLPTTLRKTAAWSQCVLSEDEQTNDHGGLGAGDYAPIVLCGSAWCWLSCIRCLASQVCSSMRMSTAWLRSFICLFDPSSCIV